MIEQLRSVFESDPRVAYALIFGSSVTGKAHAHSDVDVAIGMAGPHQLDTMELGALASRLEAAAGRRVDLVLLDEAPPGLAYRAFRDGHPIFTRDPAVLTTRRARAILEYLDLPAGRGALHARRAGCARWSTRHSFTAKNPRTL